ncbi:MAG: alkaline phosphatase D family protein [Terricaulis sp.]
MSESKLTRRGALASLATGAAAACARDVATPPYEGEVAFRHGVASGDPTHDRVVIWTRATPVNDGPVPVRWIVARNRELTDVVKTGIVVTNSARDYTLKVDVLELRSGAPYFYGFRAGAAESAIGKTRTLPRGATERLVFAAVSCASYAHGYFNAYDALAKRDDVDVVIHLGDYIYEYGLSGYGGEVAVQLGRIPAPEVELKTLADYRQRHAQYKTEAPLQAAHAAFPWIVAWDDHEIANDCWTGGAENHQRDEGDWAARKHAALQAYYEWMPIRDPSPGRAFEAINRSFQFGDLATLVMLETRLLARTQPLDYARDLPIQMQRWDFSNPAAPVALRVGEADRAGQRLLPAIYEAVNEEMRPVLDWRRAQGLVGRTANLPAGFTLAPDVARLRETLGAPERALLGAAQEQWLADELANSSKDGVVWRVIGNQVLMAAVDAPDLSRTPAQLSAALERLRPGITQLLKLTRFAFPMSADGWDGYPGSRARVLEAMRAAGGATIVLSGDSHIAWANELNDGRGRVSVELGATSITSPSDASYFQSAGIDFAGGVRARNPHVKWMDAARHGYLLLTLSREQANAEFFAVSTISEPAYETSRVAAFAIAAESGGPLTPL